MWELLKTAYESTGNGTEMVEVAYLLNTTTLEVNKVKINVAG